MENVLAHQNAHESLEAIEKIFEKYDGKLDIFAFLNIFKKLYGDNEPIMQKLISPFEKLQFMPSLAAKRIISGSVQMFLDSDEDKDGQLDKVHFKCNY